MLNPRAYRAALLEQLTAAAAAAEEEEEAPPPPLPPQSDSDAVRSEDSGKRKSIRDLTHRAPPSKLLLPREIVLEKGADRPTASTTRDACIIEDSVLRHRQPALHSSTGERQSSTQYTRREAAQPPSSPEAPSYTSSHGYSVERESNRSLILSFIDNCIRAGVPEEMIAEQVQFMVASMKESLALHATLHAQRHKERICEYELGALINMVERQQLQLTQQQQSVPAPSIEYGYSTSPPAASPASPQLPPPPPLVYVPTYGPEENRFFNTRQRHNAVRQPNLHTTHSVYPTSPRRPPPSPPRDDSPLSRADVHRCSAGHSPMARAPVSSAAWREAARDDDESVGPFVQLWPTQRQGRKIEDKSKEIVRVSHYEVMNPKASPLRSNRPSPSPEGKGAGLKGSTTTTAHAGHHHHRSHHALCNVCLCNATEEKGEQVSTAKQRKPCVPLALVKSGGKSPILPTTRKVVAAPATPGLLRRTSPSKYRQRYQPKGHYMKPTHASLVRRTSSTSPTRLEQTPTISHAPSPSTSQRKLVVRSTYSSRLRAAATRQQSDSVESNTSEKSTAGDGSHEEVRTALYRHGGHTGDCYDERTSSNSSSGRETSILVEEVAGTKPRRGKRSKRDTTDKKVCRIDLFGSNVSPLSVSTPSRVTAVAQTDGWVSPTDKAAAAPDASTTPAPPPSVWKLSVEPESHSSLNRTTAADDSVQQQQQQQQHSSVIDATKPQWQQASTTSPPLTLTGAATDERSNGKHLPQQQQQLQSAVTGNNEKQRPRRNAPAQPTPSTTTSSSATSTVGEGQSQQLLACHEGLSHQGAHTASNKGSLHAAALPLPAASVGSGDDNDDKVVCVTSPELQLFLETSQRKVRETERLLARTPSPAQRTKPAVAIAATATSVQCSPSRTSTVHFTPQSRWKGLPQQQQQPQRSVEEIVRVSHTSTLLRSSSPTHRDVHSSLWSDRSSLDTARQKQQQRLQELRDRLREYDTPAKQDVHQDSVVRGFGEATLNSAMTYSSAWSQDRQFPFEPHYMPPPTSSLENSPLIQISPTSSDDEADDA